MDKLTFINNQEPALNDTNLNQIQTNVENAINATKPHQINVGEDTDYRVNLLKTKNLFDKNSELVGQYISTTDGTLISNTDWNCSNLIKVKPNTTYTYTTVNPNTTISQIEVAFYNGTTFISGSQQNDSDGGEWNYTFTTPANCNSVRVSYRNGRNYQDIQLEEGSTATEYAPFIPNQIVVDNEKYSDTINVGATEDSRSRINVLHSKNLYIPFKGTQTQNGITITGNADGSATISGTATANSDIYSAGGPDTYAPIKLENGYYTISGAPNQSSSTYQLFAVFKDSSNNTKIMISGQTDLLTNIVGVRFFVRSFNGANVNTTIYPMANKGTTALPFEPYVVPSIKVDNEEIYRKPEIGTNGNGNYIKYADGTMICYGEIRQTATSDWILVNFPEQFINNPVITANAFSDYATTTTLVVVKISAPTVSSFKIATVTSSGYAGTLANYIAIGRWK